MCFPKLLFFLYIDPNLKKFYTLVEQREGQ